MRSAATSIAWVNYSLILVLRKFFKLISPTKIVGQLQSVEVNHLCILCVELSFICTPTLTCESYHPSTLRTVLRRYFSTR